MAMAVIPRADNGAVARDAITASRPSQRHGSQWTVEGDVFVAAQYHGHWFWINDRDLVSKRGLLFIMLLSTLADSGANLAPPVLSISKP
jgi:hypothetical protein